jgi:hypothetical protein
MVTVPQYWGQKSVSFRGGLGFWRGLQRPCLRFIGDTTSHSIPRPGSQHQDQEHVTLCNDSRRRPARRKPSARELAASTSRNYLSRTESQSQYMGCHPAASVSRLGESSGRLPPPPKMVLRGSIGESRALIRGALPIFLGLASRITMSTGIRKCGASSRQEWPLRMSCPQRLFSSSST